MKILRKLFGAGRAENDCQRCGKRLLAKSEYVAMCKSAGLEVLTLDLEHISGTCETPEKDTKNLIKDILEHISTYGGIREEDAIRLIKGADDVGLVCHDCAKRYCMECEIEIGSPHRSLEGIGFACPNCGACLYDIE